MATLSEPLQTPDSIERVGLPLDDRRLGQHDEDRRSARGADDVHVEREG